MDLEKFSRTAFILFLSILILSIELISKEINVNKYIITGSDKSSCQKYKDITNRYKTLDNILHGLKSNCQNGYYAFSQDIIKDQLPRDNDCTIKNANYISRRLEYTENLIRRISDYCTEDAIPTTTMATKTTEKPPEITFEDLEVSGFIDTDFIITTCILRNMGEWSTINITKESSVIFTISPGSTIDANLDARIKQSFNGDGIEIRISLNYTSILCSDEGIYTCSVKTASVFYNTSMKLSVKRRPNLLGFGLNIDQVENTDRMGSEHKCFGNTGYPAGQLKLEYLTKDMDKFEPLSETSSNLRILSVDMGIGACETNTTLTFGLKMPADWNQAIIRCSIESPLLNTAWLAINLTVELILLSTCNDTVGEVYKSNFYNCRRYIHCSNGIPYVKECQYGLFFGIIKSTGILGTNCDYASNVICEKDITTIPTTTMATITTEKPPGTYSSLKEESLSLETKATTEVSSGVPASITSTPSSTRLSTTASFDEGFLTNTSPLSNTDYSFKVLNPTMQEAIINDYQGNEVWYPPLNSFKSAEVVYKTCFIKIGTVYSNTNLRFRVISKNEHFTLLGIHEKGLTNGSACIEYRCSVQNPDFDLSRAGSNDFFRYPTTYTNVQIFPIGQVCYVSDESRILRSHEQTNMGFSSNQSNVGNQTFEAFIPDIEYEGIYFHKSNTFADIDSARKTAIKECNTGIHSSFSYCHDTWCRISSDI